MHAFARVMNVFRKARYTSLTSHCQTFLILRLPLVPTTSARGDALPLASRFSPRAHKSESWKNCTEFSRITEARRFAGRLFKFQKGR
jgi:hypothetical protein